MSNAIRKNREGRVVSYRDYHWPEPWEKIRICRACGAEFTIFKDGPIWHRAKIRWPRPNRCSICRFKNKSIRPWSKVTDMHRWRQVKKRIQLRKEVLRSMERDGVI